MRCKSLPKYEMASSPSLLAGGGNPASQGEANTHVDRHSVRSAVIGSSREARTAG